MRRARGLLALAVAALSLVPLTGAGAAPHDPAHDIGTERSKLEGRSTAAALADDVEYNAAAIHVVLDPRLDNGPGYNGRGDIIGAGASNEAEAVVLLVAVDIYEDPHAYNWRVHDTGVLWEIDVNGDNRADYKAFFLYADGRVQGDVTDPNLRSVCAADPLWDAANQSYAVGFPPGCIGDPASFNYTSFMLYGTDFTTSSDGAPDSLGFVGPVKRGGGAPAPAPAPPPGPTPVNCAGGAGYWLLGRDGGVFSFGTAPFYGSTGNIRLNQPVVGMTRAPVGKGYWFVAADGGIFAYGPNAGFFGSTGSIRLAQPIVGMATTPTGKGYWLVARDGGLFAFGDAGFFGSRGGQPGAPIIGMGTTPTGKGYWLASSDGSVYAFGDAKFHGAAVGRAGNSFVAFAARPQGDGYWFVTIDGAVHGFGAAPYRGGRNGKPGAPIAGAASSANGGGYRLVATDGSVYTYGASSCGGMNGRSLSAPMVGISTA